MDGEGERVFCYVGEEGVMVFGKALPEIKISNCINNYEYFYDLDKIGNIALQI